MSDRVAEINAMSNTGMNRGRLSALARFGTRPERLAAESRLREWRAAARASKSTAQPKAATTTREQVNTALRQRGWPEMRPEPTTKQERAAARLRNMGITPISDQPNGPTAA
ncbi:hypothetical protein [Plantactinospora sp. CA-290183]|uniref:hypothetical protein n=1 Tax=Plantactinospora sp. CA-290183 TaxID=3240006 RepID=UPI003D8BE36B